MKLLTDIAALGANLPFVAVSFAIAGKGNRLLWLLLGSMVYLCLLLRYLLIDTCYRRKPPCRIRSCYAVR